MGRTAVKRLRQEGAARVIVANRTFARSRELVSDAGFGEAVEMPELVDAVADADVVVASTGASHFVLDEARVRAAMARRPQRPLFIVDIAVPRDVDPAVAAIENVSLVDIDGLTSVVNEQLELRREAIPHVEEIIGEYVERFENWYRARVAVPVIARLTQKAEAIRAAELERLFARCPDLDERERMLVTGMTMTIVSKLLHSAILRIREKAAIDGTEALSSARVLDDLFELNSPVENKRRRPRLLSRCRPGRPGPAYVTSRRSSAQRRRAALRCARRRRDRCARAAGVRENLRRQARGRSRDETGGDRSARDRQGSRGMRVVRLKGGDPFVFGRGGEEAEALQRSRHFIRDRSRRQLGARGACICRHSRHASRLCGIVHRAYRTRGSRVSRRPRSIGRSWRIRKRTLVMLMATANLREIAGELVAHGLDASTPVAVVQDGTRPSQRTVSARLETIADDVARAKIGAPAVVNRRRRRSTARRLRWFDTGPLFGKRVLVTRTGEQSETFARALRRRGAEPILAPTIAFEAPDDPTSAERALDALDSFDWLVFTSQNGVDAFFERLASRNADARALGTARVAAIGERTADRLRSYGISADVVPPVFVAEEVARAVIERSRAADRVLVFRAQDARDVLPRMLEDAGLSVTVVAAYKTVVPNDPEFAAKVARADVLTFTSASTVKGFAALLGSGSAAVEAARGKLVACIGPITANAATELGLIVDVVAKRYTTEGLLAALDAKFAAPT